MGDLRLEGCRVEPLGSYLKALGVFRIVAEQLDPGATGRWDGEVFVLATDRSIDDLIDFFVDDYCPTPIVTPWNGRGGFRHDVDRPSEQMLRRIEESSDTRLVSIRAAIDAGRDVFSQLALPGWTKTDVTKAEQAEAARHVKKHKEDWVSLTRSFLPDNAVEWIDAVAVLTDDGAAFPPLLGGSGGVFGSFDISQNYLSSLEVILGIGTSPDSGEDRRAWFHSCVLNAERMDLVGGQVGQFEPGGKGGPNSDPLGDGGVLANPWEFPLILEGSLLFASGAARRMGPDQTGKASMPFTSNTSAAGYSTAAPNEKTKGEFWAPIWGREVLLAELRRLASEGRMEWKGRVGRDGLDFVRAVASLGADRGIDSFVRYTFVERHGQDVIAVPAGRIAVRERPEVPVLGALDPWLGRVRWQKNAPSSVASLVRQVDESQFDAATGGGPSAVQQVLLLTARLEQTVARSTNLREKVSPVSGLSAADWIPALDDGSPELRLAVAFVSQGDGAGGDRTALYFRPVETSGRRLDWRNGGHRIEGVGLAPISTVLAAVLERRVIDVADSPADQDLPQVGVQAAFRYRIPAPLEDVGAFLNGEVDDERLASLIAACCLLDFGKGVDQPAPPSGAHRGMTAPALALLAPFSSGRELSLEAQEVRLVPAASWPRLLRSGRVSGVIDDALQRLKVARLVPLLADAEIVARDIDATRLAAALTFPISTWAANGCLEQVAATTADPPNSR